MHLASLGTGIALSFLRATWLIEEDIIMGSIFSFGSRTADKAMSCIDWESRYDGALSVAIIDHVPVAGISGPWPDGNYALTFWSIRELEVAPSLEFHTSIEFARRRVEEMANRIASTT
jgi:hypothetical protein